MAAQEKKKASHGMFHVKRFAFDLKRLFYNGGVGARILKRCLFDLFDLDEQS